MVTATQKDTLGDEEKAGAKALTNGRFYKVDTGHDLIISEPEWAADTLMKVTAAPA